MNIWIALAIAYGVLALAQIAWFGWAFWSYCRKQSLLGGVEALQQHHDYRSAGML